MILRSVVGACLLFVLVMCVDTRQPVTKTDRSDVCINSACEHPCTDKPKRFVRHKGECR